MDFINELINKYELDQDEVEQAYAQHLVKRHKLSESDEVTLMLSGVEDMAEKAQQIRNKMDVGNSQESLKEKSVGTMVAESSNDAKKLQSEMPNPWKV